MEIYRLKHIPSEWYYQPHKHRGSNVSKRGKIYHTATHGLSCAFRHTERLNKFDDSTFSIYVQKNSTAHKHFDKFVEFRETLYDKSQLKAETKLSDWIVEKIYTNEDNRAI